MKRTIFYTTTALMLAFSACNNAGEERTEAQELEGVHSEDLHEKHTDQEDLSREAHLKMVKAEEVQSFNNVSEQTQKNLRAFTEQYLQLKEALVASNSQKAAATASTMLQGLKAWDGKALQAEQKDFAQKRTDNIRDNLQQIVNNEELTQQRDHFARLSKDMTELVSAFGSGKGTLYYQYCPMAFNNKGAYWLSSSKEIRNPYHPEEMLTCGRVAKEL